MTEPEECVVPPVTNARPESVMIMLTRMEGKLDRFSDRVVDLRSRVDMHDVEVGQLKALTQSLKEGAVASTEKAEALALALKEAKEAVEATALQEASKAAVAAREKTDKDALGWSPVTKLFAIAAAIATLILIYQQLVGGI